MNFEITLYGITLYEFLIRVLLACIIGGLFGLERKAKGKPAGIKTNMLVCGGAAIVSIIQIMISNKTGLEPLNSNLKSDTTRLIAPVITGLGFLGAGVIMRGGDTVKGLTTAATLWLVAVLGIGIGSGFAVFIIPSSIMILVLSFIIKHFETTVIENRKIRKVILEYEQNTDIEEIIRDMATEKDIKIIIDKKISEVDDGEHIVVKKIMSFSIPKYVSSKYFFNIIKKFEGVVDITGIH